MLGRAAGREGFVILLGNGAQTDPEVPKLRAELVLAARVPGALFTPRLPAADRGPAQAAGAPTAFQAGGRAAEGPGQQHGPAGVQQPRTRERVGAGGPQAEAGAGRHTPVPCRNFQEPSVGRGTCEGAGGWCLSQKPLWPVPVQAQPPVGSRPQEGRCCRVPHPG